MSHTYVLALRDSSGTPNITRQFPTYEDLLSFINQSAENAPIIMAMVLQPDGFTFALVPIAAVKPGISMLNQVEKVQELEPTVVEVTPVAPVAAEVAPHEVEISAPASVPQVTAELPQVVPSGYRKVGKRKSGTLVAGKHK
jgi:hypothetical protein